VDQMAEDKFCRVENYSVLIPYEDLVKMVDLAKKVDQIEDQYARLQEQYVAIRGMFSECLDKIKEIREFVGNS
ncbi:MAG: hypothetical protein IJE78_16145, partial [Bacteroidaceae bacterium]|nr:hypothetical protein [Bacteroidaceae bacterium]